MMVCQEPRSCRRSLTALIAVIAAALSFTAAAQTVYKVTDKNGRITYTDVAPAPGENIIEEVAVPETNTARPVLPAAAQVDEAANSASPTPDYVTVISLPADGATIPMGPGDFSVEAQASPALGAAERLQLEVDGALFGPPQAHSHWQLTNIFRGAHALRVMRLDESGNTIDTSEISTVYVLRPSVLK